MWSLRLKISNWENTKRSAAVLFGLHVARFVYLSSSMFVRSSGCYFLCSLVFLLSWWRCFDRVVLYIACWINMWSRYRHSYTRTYPIHSYWFPIVSFFAAGGEHEPSQNRFCPKRMQIKLKFVLWWRYILCEFLELIQRSMRVFTLYSIDLFIGNSLEFIQRTFCLQLNSK